MKYQNGWISSIAEKLRNPREEMENSEEPTSLQSICHLHASELFPKHTHFECEDQTLTVPFTLLSGEFIVALGRTSDGVLALSNYRLYLQLNQACYNIPLGLIEQLEVKEIFFLHIGCKDARSLSCVFATNEHCLEWFKRLHKVTYPRKSIEDIFAFAYYAWSVEEGKDNSKLGKDSMSYNTTFNSEVERLKFNLHGTWRISQINKDYRICPSYPPLLLVPSCIPDDSLEVVAKFRSFRRIPAVVWRHVNNGAVIARSSQPEVGWLGWRSPDDEHLLKALSDACSYDKGESTMMDSSIIYPDNGDDGVTSNKTKKVLIVDARSYTTAVANRARGGGCECPEYYPSCDIQFMNLPNIHSIRKSFHAVRQLCASDADQPK
ncbi:myotubularin-related protein 3-like isoform X1 [Frieseomelitta varia]|uniref:myotubularin-related protein 3-like isoform X1 n=2 Tax=Frieseomelitta varia TaxID=561572 RepID=UPI001CB68977|nr:myotubularin-related protein 3-like isoform X1 [Frieseomelitta varia]